MTDDRPPRERDRLRRTSQRIEALLDELAASAGPTTHARVEELVQHLVTLYGAGLEGVLACAAASGSEGERLGEQLTGDEVVTGLLVLHDLHPWPVQRRVEHALAAVRPYLGSHAGGVELLGLEDGVARLRMTGTCHGCPSSRATIDHAIRDAIEAAAPELSRIDVEQRDAPPRRLSIEERADRRWTPIEADLPRGHTSALQVGGFDVLLLRSGEALLAYRNACPGCNARLDAAGLDAAVLTCPVCGRRYDVTRAGRPVEPAEGRPLEPLPLLVDSRGARVSLPGGSP